MRKWRQRVTIFAVLALLAVAAIYTFGGIPDVAAAAMRNASSFELLSIAGSRASANGEFHGCKVLGRTTVTDAAIRKRLYNALQSGTRWSLPFRALCFNPRHGIRVTANGHTVDLVICFECSQVQVWEGDNHVTTFTVGSSPEPVFDQALRDAGLPLADK